MRYLSKFNESNEEFDVEYFATCFVDLIDEFDGEYEHETIGEKESKQQVFFVAFNLPRVKSVKRKWSIDLSDDISDRIKYSEECLEFYKDIEVAIKKVKINYPDYKVEINHETEDFGSGIEGTVYRESYIQIEFIEPIKTKTIEKNLEKGKLNFINSSELNGTWDVK